MATRSRPCALFGALMLSTPITLPLLSLALVMVVLAVSVTAILAVIASLFMGAWLFVAASVDTTASFKDGNTRSYCTSTRTASPISYRWSCGNTRPAELALQPTESNMLALATATEADPNPAACSTFPSCGSITSSFSRSRSDGSESISFSEQISVISTEDATGPSCSGEATLSAAASAACEHQHTQPVSTSINFPVVRPVNDLSRLTESFFLSKYGLARCKFVRVLGTGSAVMLELVSILMQDNATTRLAVRKYHLRDTPALEKRCAAEITGLLAGADCPHAVKMLGCAMHPEHSELLLEFAEGGSLESELDIAYERREAQKDPAARMILSEERIKQIALGLLTALDGYHSKGFVHGDVKPASVLLRASSSPTGASIPILSDFECCSKLNADGCLDSCTGTGIFCAPEVVACLYGQQVATRRTAKTDMFSVGVLLAMCAAYHKMPVRLANNYLRGDSRLPAIVPAGLKDLINSLTALDQAARPTAAVALKHPYLQQSAK